MNILHRCQQLSFPSQRLLVVPTLPQRTATSVCEMVTAGKATFDELHDLPEAGSKGGGQYKVQVVGHHDERQQAKSAFAPGIVNDLRKQARRVLRTENGPSLTDIRGDQRRV